MRQHGPVNVIVYHPKTSEGERDLAVRVAQVHADAVDTKIRMLGCPSEQKRQLLDAVVASVKQRMGRQGSDVEHPVQA